jgi:hypothetical protein
VHCYLIYLRYYGSLWPEDDFFKSKLVASLHVDYRLMCFRLILILSNLAIEPCNSVEMRRHFGRSCIFICKSSLRNVHIIRRYLVDTRICHIKIPQNNSTFIFKKSEPINN